MMASWSTAVSRLRGGCVSGAEVKREGGARRDWGGNVAVFFTVSVSCAHDALEAIDFKVVHDPSCEGLACDGCARRISRTSPGNR